MEERVKTLESQVQELMQALADRKLQQLSSPIDDPSRNLMLDGVPRKSADFVSGSPVTNGSIKMKIDGQEFNFMTT